MKIVQNAGESVELDEHEFTIMIKRHSTLNRIDIYVNGAYFGAIIKFSDGSYQTHAVEAWTPSLNHTVITFGDHIHSC